MAHAWASQTSRTGTLGNHSLLPGEIDEELEIEIAFPLDKSFWHRGLATEAAQSILKYGFEELKLSRLICLIDPDNLASQKVAEKIGMTLERKVDAIGGDNFPTLIYSVSKNRD